MHYDLMRYKHKRVSERVSASRGVKLSDRPHSNILNWGWLDSVGTDQDGLVRVILTGQNCLPVVAEVPLELASKLRHMVGQQIVMARIEGRWSWGMKTA